MREIKFRAKSTHSNDWVYGNFIHSKRFNGCSNEFRIHEQETGIESDVLFETLGQFIGIKDKNARDIYDGDIFTVDGRYPKIIKFIEDRCSFGHANLYDLHNEFAVDIWNVPSSKWYYDYQSVIEVIGNIYDNQELLKQNKL